MAAWKIVLIVVAGLVFVFGFMLVAVLGIYLFLHSASSIPTAAQTFVPAESYTLATRLSPSITPVTDLDDYDALAARMTTDHDLYVRMRDEALASYAKRHPIAAPYDDNVKKVIRGMVYNIIWADPYGEGLWNNTERLAGLARQQGSDDPILDIAQDYSWYDQKPFDYATRFADLESKIERIEGTDYPSEIRLGACGLAMDCLISYKEKYHFTMASPHMDVLSKVLAFWGQRYRELIRQKASNAFLYDHAAILQDHAAYDQESLDLVIAEQDRAFNELAPDNPARWAVDGDYYTNSAWCARSGGWASEVTPEGWRLFAERLAKARDTLVTGYGKYPHEEELPRLMIRVVLGQQKDRTEMELWFQRAIDIDPDDFDAYAAKEWYLQPRWYGSVDDLLEFGQECVKTQNWEHAIPMIFCKGMGSADELDSTVYQREDIWTPIEKTYRNFLARYPASIFYRTNFAHHAYTSGHRDIAREQLKILGDRWDRSVLTDDDYKAMMADLDGH